MTDSNNQKNEEIIDLTEVVIVGKAKNLVAAGVVNSLNNSLAPVPNMPPEDLFPGNLLDDMMEEFEQSQLTVSEDLVEPSSGDLDLSQLDDLLGSLNLDDETDILDEEDPFADLEESFNGVFDSDSSDDIDFEKENQIDFNSSSDVDFRDLDEVLGEIVRDTPESKNVFTQEEEANNDALQLSQDIDDILDFPSLSVSTEEPSLQNSLENVDLEQLDSVVSDNGEVSLNKENISEQNIAEQSTSEPVVEEVKENAIKEEAMKGTPDFSEAVASLEEQNELTNFDPLDFERISNDVEQYSELSSNVEDISDSADAVAEDISDSADAVAENISDSADAVAEDISDSADAVAEATSIDVSLDSQESTQQNVDGGILATALATALATQSFINIDEKKMVDEKLAENNEKITHLESMLSEFNNETVTRLDILQISVDKLTSQVSSVETEITSFSTEKLSADADIITKIEKRVTSIEGRMMHLEEIFAEQKMLNDQLSRILENDVPSPIETKLQGEVRTLRDDLTDALSRINSLEEGLERDIAKVTAKVLREEIIPLLSEA